MLLKITLRVKLKAKRPRNLSHSLQKLETTTNLPSICTIRIDNPVVGLLLPIFVGPGNTGSNVIVSESGSLFGSNEAVSQRGNTLRFVFLSEINTISASDEDFKLISFIVSEAVCVCITSLRFELKSLVIHQLFCRLTCMTTLVWRDSWPMYLN